MAKKLMSWKTKGMNRDFSVSAFNPEFAFENINLRIATNKSNTFMSWVNEKGTAQISIVTGNWVDGDDSTLTTITSMAGIPVGTAVINHKLVIFTHDASNNTDYIYILRYYDTAKTQMLCKLLFSGNLSFKEQYPLETLVSYESETVQKVYWTDGNKQPRVINIVANYSGKPTTVFDFVPTLKLDETVSIKKVLGASGMFAPGVIQYAFTYYNKYGQESNIFYTSPLLYISYRDRGASPEDRVENAFSITVTNPDTYFDYLRIYSIQRTSVDATPICKRIQDISLANVDKNDEDKNKVSYTDTGMSGDSIDPTELLYKGGEVVSAKTFEQKDNTLFLGNLGINRQQLDTDLKTSLKNNISVSSDTRRITATQISTDNYDYSNQLTAFDASGNSTSCAGFKSGDTYRLGVQFQHKTGKWSDPVWVGDWPVGASPSIDSSSNLVNLPLLRGRIRNDDLTTLLSKEYMRVRGVFVVPRPQDRTILYQGILNPTVYTSNHRTDADLHSQASWFFRPSYSGSSSSVDSSGAASPVFTGELAYTHRGIGNSSPESGCHNYNPDGNNVDKNIRLVEIEGDYDTGNRFSVDDKIVTFNSPDVEFDTELSLTDYSSTQYRQIGYADFMKTLSDIDIQTETPTISSTGAGFVHKSFIKYGSFGIVAGLFYDDYLVDELHEEAETRTFGAYREEREPYKWLVFPWNMTASLNNDFNRPANTGTRTAKLKKKVISNLRYSTLTPIGGTIIPHDFESSPQLFSSNEVSIVKLGSEIYMGNIDTSVIPDHSDGSYFAFSDTGTSNPHDKKDTSFNSRQWWKTFSMNATKLVNGNIYRHIDDNHDWAIGTDSQGTAVEWIASNYLDVVLKKSPVRIKYKSTPHLVFKLKSSNSGISWSHDTYWGLPVVEIIQNGITSRFGGDSPDALRENVWIPSSEPVALSSIDGNTDIPLWVYGDTYFQRWDCLKTYAFTPEDINQIVEIGSFMLETRTNIDGRYDRNRGQLNNLNMSPQNFNLINPVYSQKDNFFQYRIQDEDYYANNVFPNQITWSKTKESGADVDLWTNITLASVLELDGDRGEVTSLQRLNDQLICFQDSGFSQIMYNGNVMVESSQGVPIEIANSGKVQGKSYFSNTVGCSNKWSIANTPMGIYFMDSNEKSIYMFNGQLVNLSSTGGFNSWTKGNIPASTSKWTPNLFGAFRSCYDRLNQDVLFINDETALAYSEKFGMFTSFYDYGHIPFFENLDDTGIWIKDTNIWKHNAGDYCKFFGTAKPYSMTLVGNPEPQIDKTFTNLEFRACVDGDGTLNASTGKFTPKLPFDFLETWNEYQHGYTSLENKNGHSLFKHGDSSSALIRKFRIWRSDIPRNNALLGNPTGIPYSTDAELGISRLIRKPNDRMRNPWLYLKLKKNADDSMSRTEIHDVVMTYFD